MKLKLFQKNKISEGTEEFVFFNPLEADNSGDDIPRPLGISKDEWTPDLKAHFADIKKFRPKLYEKIVKGH